MKITDEMVTVFLDALPPRGSSVNKPFHKALEAVAPLIAAQERELCAKVSETHPMRFGGQHEDAVRAAFAAAIRARSDD